MTRNSAWNSVKVSRNAITLYKTGEEQELYSLLLTASQSAADSR